jgi:hypothetical protein
MRKNNQTWQPWRAGFLLLSLLLSWPVLSQAQGRPPDRRKNWDERPGSAPESRGERGKAPDWGRRPGSDFRVPSFEMFADSRVVKSAPYSATVITETVQTLASGARITHSKTDTVYRDSEGRTRREQQFDRIGPFSMGDQPQQIVFINDVVSGTRVFLDPARQTARKLGGGTPPPPPFLGPRPQPGSEIKTEALGKQLIEDVEAEGTRTTVTIPTGKIGNDRPLEIISERWESTELKVVVLSKYIDPFAGETTYRLTNIKRAEQPSTLFEVPADYKLAEERPQPNNWPGRRKGPPE